MSTMMSVPLESLVLTPVSTPVRKFGDITNSSKDGNVKDTPRTQMKKLLQPKANIKASAPFRSKSAKSVYTNAYAATPSKKAMAGGVNRKKSRLQQQALSGNQRVSTVDSTLHDRAYVKPMTEALEKLAAEKDELALVKGPMANLTVVEEASQEHALIKGPKSAVASAGLKKKKKKAPPPPKPPSKFKMKLAERRAAAGHTSIISAPPAAAPTIVEKVVVVDSAAVMAEAAKRVAAEAEVAKFTVEKAAAIKAAEANAAEVAALRSASEQKMQVIEAAAEEAAAKVVALEAKVERTEADAREREMQIVQEARAREAEITSQIAAEQAQNLSVLQETVSQAQEAQLSAETQAQLALRNALTAKAATEKIVRALSRRLSHALTKGVSLMEEEVQEACAVMQQIGSRQKLLESQEADIMSLQGLIIKRKQGPVTRRTQELAQLLLLRKHRVLPQAARRNMNASGISIDRRVLAGVEEAINEQIKEKDERLQLQDEQLNKASAMLQHAARIKQAQDRKMAEMARMLNGGIDPNRGGVDTMRKMQNYHSRANEAMQAELDASRQAMAELDRSNRQLRQQQSMSEVGGGSTKRRSKKVKKSKSSASIGKRFSGIFRKSKSSRKLNESTQSTQSMTVTNHHHAAAAEGGRPMSTLFDTEIV